MLAPPPYSLTANDRVGLFVWKFVAQLSKSVATPEYHPKYLLYPRVSVCSAIGSVSLTQHTARAVTLLGSSWCASVLSWPSNVFWSGEPRTSIAMLQKKIDGWLMF